MDKQEVEIHRRMTVAALAQAMDRDTGEPGGVAPQPQPQPSPPVCPSDHVMEALLHLDLASLEPDSVLEEDWIKEAVIRSGMKFRWAQLSQSRERVNRDAYRR